MPQTPPNEIANQQEFTEIYKTKWQCLVNEMPQKWNCYQQENTVIYKNEMAVCGKRNAPKAKLLTAKIHSNLEKNEMAVSGSECPKNELQKLKVPPTIYKNLKMSQRFIPIRKENAKILETQGL